MRPTTPPARRHLIWLALGALTGCATLNPAQRPEVKLPARWEGATAYSTARVAADLHWRDFIQDARLRALIERALAHNADVRLAYARIEEARAAYGFAQAERKPALTLVSSYQASRTPTAVTGTALYEIERYDLNLALSPFEIDLWGRMASLGDAARARALAAREAARTVRMTLIGDIANAYFSLLELDERTRLATETLRLRETMAQLVELALSQGATARLELLQAQSGVEAARSELEAIKRQRQATAHLLAQLVGYVDGDLPEGVRLAAQSLDAAFATGLPSEVMLRRPDVIAAEQRLAEANANIAAARAAFFPRIMLAAGVGVASAALGNLFGGSQSLAASLAPSVSLPIFDGGRAAASEEVATARAKASLAEYERTVQTAFREVADLLAAQHSFRAQKRSAGAEFAIQLQRYDTLEARWRAGAASQMEVLEVLRQRFVAEQNLVQLRRIELTIAMQLYKALGGGGDLPEDAALKP